MNTPSTNILFGAGLRADQMPLANDPRRITISEYTEQDILATTKLLRDSNKSLENKIAMLQTLKNLRTKNEELNVLFDTLAKEAQEHPNIIYK
jgi:hypothetical protein